MTCDNDMEISWGLNKVTSSNIVTLEIKLIHTQPISTISESLEMKTNKLKLILHFCHRSYFAPPIAGVYVKWQ